MNAFWIALRFLTRIPAPTPDYDEASLAKSIVYYGWVGALVGLLASLPFALLHSPALLGAALLVALMQWLSGGLHLDGLADCADAWVGGRDREHTLAIMKDPHIGAMGVAVLICTLLLQFSAIAALPSGIHLLAYIVTTCAISRTAAACLLITTAYVRPNGIATPLTQGSGGLLALHSILLLSLLVLFTGKIALLSLASVALVFLLGRTVCMGRLGGITGDTVGALIVLAETVTFTLHALL